MTGSLLQLVATGIDSIFLTHNPSVTLFKIVYRRYTNFSITTRTKQIKNITDFDKDGYYILQKEADCIHKMWLDIDLSDIELSYGTPTRQYINEICAKYGFTVLYQTDGSNNTIVTPQEYSYIIDEINSFIGLEVNKNNSLIDIIEANDAYYTNPSGTNPSGNTIEWRNDLFSVFKLKLDDLYNSYKNEVLDSSGNIKPDKHSVYEDGSFVIDSPYMNYIKLICMKLFFSQQNLIETYNPSIYNALNQDILYDYYYLDNGYYNHPEYAFKFLDGYLNGDKLDNTYTFTINRNSEISNFPDIINNMINLNMNKYIRDCLLMNNDKNIFLYNSADNNLNNIKIYNNKSYDILNITLKKLDLILTGYNPNNVTAYTYSRIYNLLSLFIFLNNKIDVLTGHLENHVYLKIQYKNLIDFIYYELLNVYNTIYNKFYVNDVFIDTINITISLLISSGYIIRDFFNMSNYILTQIIDVHENNTVYNQLSNHIENKFYNMYSQQNKIDTSSIQYKFDLEKILRSAMIDYTNNITQNSNVSNMSKINDIMYNYYLTELTYNLIGTEMFAYNYAGQNEFFFRDENGTPHIWWIGGGNWPWLVLQNLYNCMVLIHIVESNIPNNLNYVDICGNYMGNLSDVSKYYGYTMLDYFNKIIESQNNRNIPILNFNHTGESAVQYTDLDTYKIIKKFLKNSDIIYDYNSFSPNFIFRLTQTIKQNQYANIEIFYNIVLNRLLAPSYHNIAVNSNLQQSTLNLNNKRKLYYNINGDYYKFIFYKTFTNNVSDTIKFSTILNSKITGLSDNVISLLNKYQQNKNTYEVYFSNEILNRIYDLNYDIQIIYENEFFVDYFNDISIWSKYLLNSQATKNILQQFTFDDSNGNIINLNYYFDASGILQPRNIYDPLGGYSYINSEYNIYDKFISPLSTIVKENIIFLNYTPMYTIRDIFTNLYEIISNYNNQYINPYKQYFKYFFDYRDFNEYNPIINSVDISGGPLSLEQIYAIIQNNNTFKNDLYRTVILNVILKVNEDFTYNGVEFDTYASTDDFRIQIFQKNLFKVADYEYLTAYANNYLISNRIGLFGLLRPENLINIYSSDVSNNVSIYTLEKDSSGNIVYDSSGNPVQTTDKKALYVPIIRGIVEKIRIQMIRLLYSDQIISSIPGIIIPDYEKKTIYDDLMNNYINPLLDNYIKFDDTSNLNLSDYSYINYRNNGYIFSDINNNVISASKKFIVTNQKYIQASSSIWSYINKMQTREYNKMYNELLISRDYFINNLGFFMKDVYNEFNFRLSNVPQASYTKLPHFYSTDYSKYYYSYNITQSFGNPSGTLFTYDQDFNIYENYKTSSYYPNENILNETYPIANYGFDYYSLGDDINFIKTIVDASNNIYNYTFSFEPLDYMTIFDPLTQNTTLIDWYLTINSIMLSIDMRRSNPNPLDPAGNGYNFFLDGVTDGYGTPYYVLYKYPATYISQMTPYYSNLMRIRNKKYDPEINKKTLSDIIDYFNDCSGGVYTYYSYAEQQIAERFKNLLLQYPSYITYYDVLFKDYNVGFFGKSIKSFVQLYDSSANPFNNNTEYIEFQHMQDIDASGNITPINPPYYLYNKSKEYFDTFVTYDSSRKQQVFDYLNIILSLVLPQLNSNLGEVYFNGFSTKGDLINFMIYIIMIDIFNDLNIPFVLQKLNIDIDIYDNILATLYNEQKLDYFNTIKNLTIPRTSDIIITNDKKITFSSNLQYIDYLYEIPDYYTQTEILYYGSPLDEWLRNVIYKNPVKYCWVPELAYYLLEKYSFYLDELLIDEYNSNLLSLLDKIKFTANHRKGINKLIGNTEYNTTYDTNNKGNLKLRIPLKFHFCTNIGLSIPMINMLYTKGTIKFKLRKLEDLLIYDTNAIITKRPKIKCNMNVQYIYLEEEERLRISKSKMEFLIEKFRYGGKFKYNYNSLIDNKLITKLALADPTKYILWRLKVIFPDKMKYNYTWNINGYLDENYNIIKTVDNIKVYFNGSTREQGQEKLFNTINPHLRYVGSLENDEYMHIYALYPLLYQPSGTANLTNIDDILIEHQLNPNFINDLHTKGLNFEIEYWAFGYNIMRYISGMGAPIFYI